MLDKLLYRPVDDLRTRRELEGSIVEKSDSIRTMQFPKRQSVP
jgi:hypothetical protein